MRPGVHITRFDHPDGPAALGSERLIEGYGLSEGTCFSTVNPVAGPRRAGTVGIPLRRQELRIVDERGTELPFGMDGEVVVRGPNVMRGYLGRPEETAKTIGDGWLYTGDIGHLDADGYLTLVGRSKDMIIRGGENIYPKEIEDVLTAARSPSRQPSSVYLTTSGERWSSPTSNRDRVRLSSPRPATGHGLRCDLRPPHDPQPFT